MYLSTLTEDGDCISLFALSACACRFEVTVTWVSLPKFMSRRGLFRTNQRLSLSNVSLSLLANEICASVLSVGGSRGGPIPTPPTRTASSSPLRLSDHVHYYIGDSSSDLRHDERRPVDPGGVAGVEITVDNRWKEVS